MKRSETKNLKKYQSWGTLKDRAAGMEETRAEKAPD